MGRIWRLFFFPAGIALGTTCAGPERLCEALRPGVVVFVGTPIHIEKSQWTSLVTFRVDDALWGLDAGDRMIKVQDSEQNHSKMEPRFVAGHRRKNGDLLIAACEGIVRPIDDPWVREFRDFIAQRSRSQLPVRVVSNPNWAKIEFADVVVEGNGLRFHGSTGRSGTFTVDALPPGAYTVSAVKRNFTLEGGPRTFLVAPGSCGDEVIRLTPDGHVGGRVVDHMGRPVANTRGFNLMGWNVAENLRDYERSQGLGSG